MNSTAIPTLDIVPEADKIPKIQSMVTENRNVHSISTVRKTQTYSNCVTVSNSLPQPNIVHSNDPVESDTPNEIHYTDCDIIVEEETDMDDVMLLEANHSDTKDLPNGETITAFFVDDTDDMLMETLSDGFIGASSDNKPSSNYVELIETNDETDDESQPMDGNDILFKDFSRKDLINEVVAARRRIQELETKLGNIQKAHVSMIKNLNNFNKVLVS